MQIKIVSWNVHRCIGTDRHYRPERIVSVLRDLNADIVALQEVDSSLSTDEGLDQLTYISNKSDMKSVMGATLERGYGVYGNAVLYKLPLVSTEFLDLSFRKNEPRGAMAASFQVGEKKLRFINTHLGLKYWERAFQLSRLFDDFLWRGDTVDCLAGDLNEWFPLAPTALRLKRSFSPSPRLATFPSTWPKLALDRIVCTGASSLDVKVVNTTEARLASDHLPLVGTLTI